MAIIDDKLIEDLIEAISNLTEEVKSLNQNSQGVGSSGGGASFSGGMGGRSSSGGGGSRSTLSKGGKKGGVMSYVDDAADAILNVVGGQVVRSGLKGIKKATEHSGGKFLETFYDKYEKVTSGTMKDVTNLAVEMRKVGRPLDDEQLDSFIKMYRTANEEAFDEARRVKMRIKPATLADRIAENELGLDIAGKNQQMEKIAQDAAYNLDSQEAIQFFKDHVMNREAHKKHEIQSAQLYQVD